MSAVASATRAVSLAISRSTQRRGVGRWCGVVGVAEGEGERDAEGCHLDGRWVSRGFKGGWGSRGMVGDILGYHISYTAALYCSPHYLPHD